jgi:hypothetical protein
VERVLQRRLLGETYSGENDSEGDQSIKHRVLETSKCGAVSA